MQLTRYWFEFEKTEKSFVKGTYIGCGVTAFDYADAIAILSAKIFKEQTLPIITNCIENIDIRKLDQGHVTPNMWPPNERGIWYPLGYQDYF